MAWQVVRDNEYSQGLEFNRRSVLECSKNGYLERIRDYLEKAPIDLRPEINCRDKEELTPLHHATIWNNIEVVDYLLRNGAFVDSRDRKMLTPLHHSAIHGRLEIMKLLHRNSHICLRQQNVLKLSLFNTTSNYLLHSYVHIFSRCIGNEIQNLKTKYK